MERSVLVIRVWRRAFGEVSLATVRREVNEWDRERVIQLANAVADEPLPEPSEVRWFGSGADLTYPGMGTRLGLRPSEDT